MELLQSLHVDSAPSFTELSRFAIITFLKTIKTILLIYPLNIAIFFIIIFLVVYKIANKFSPKTKFKATYKPLPHNENPLEEVKLLKKEIR